MLPKTPDELKEYHHMFARLDKLFKSMIHVATQNTDLQKANHRLRSENGNMAAHIAAQERVLQALQKKLNEQSQSSPN